MSGRFRLGFRMNQASKMSDKRTLQKYGIAVRIYFHSMCPILADFN